MILVKCTNKHFTLKSFNEGSALKDKYVGFILLNVVFIRSITVF